MSNYSITDLREDLAATIRALRDKENPMAVDRAKAISDVAQTIINSAKVEVDMINALGRGRVAPSGFIGSRPRDTLEQQEHDEDATGEPVASEPPNNLLTVEKPYVGKPRARSW